VRAPAAVLTAPAAVAAAGRRVAADTPSLRAAIARLQPVVRGLALRRPPPRAQRLSGVHNPWGHAATLGHAWFFLDLAEHRAVVDAVAALIGDDVILWDSELHLQAAAYRRFVDEGREGRYWPADPLAGALALVTPLQAERGAQVAALDALGPCDLADLDPAAPLLVIRYQPATSRYVRDPRAAPHRARMQDDPLVNDANRPLWLVRGADRAGNDFVTGFAAPVPRWAGPTDRQGET
jgi:hypothetical protein